MAVTPEQFKREFPEFASAQPELVAAKLADAAGMADAQTYGAQHDQFVKYMAAELLGSSPAGQFARLKRPAADGSITIYGSRARAIMRTVLGPMVL